MMASFKTIFLFKFFTSNFGDSRLDSHNLLVLRETAAHIPPILQRLYKYCFAYFFPCISSSIRNRQAPGRIPRGISAGTLKEIHRESSGEIPTRISWFGIK